MDTKAKGYLRSAVSVIPEKSSSQALQFGEHLNETHDSLKPEEGRGLRSTIGRLGNIALRWDALERPGHAMDAAAGLGDLAHVERGVVDGEVDELPADAAAVGLAVRSPVTRWPTRSKRPSFLTSI